MPSYIIEFKSTDLFAITKDGIPLASVSRVRLHEALRPHGFIGTDLNTVDRELDAVGRSEMEVPLPLSAGSTFTLRT
jgi:hypothetical protein